MEAILETEALVLRPWRLADLDQLIEGLNDLRVSPWLAFVPHPYQRSDGLKWLEHCRRLSPDEGEHPDYEFAIERKADRAVIGGVSLNNIDPGRSRAGGGIWINAAYHRRGYGREAFGERIRFAFDTLNLLEIRNGYFVGNEPSWDLQKRFGYKHTAEEPRRRRCIADGSWKDEVLTSLHRQDWIRN
ncbi:GNAT family N-acetyltransferase [Rhizobium terrae]|uniref:GNAT family N-acetyltransferase n=1 Tax=Rhizobium terrae TaxID=2171756 RepID=UPI000E3CC362|nr:GNAT family protein [Rhizobium terrae]